MLDNFFLDLKNVLAAIPAPPPQRPRQELPGAEVSTQAGRGQGQIRFRLLVPIIGNEGRINSEVRLESVAVHLLHPVHCPRW
jgi:hypothetical protein